MNFSRTDLATGIAALASQGYFVGTSSWKYEGWLGQIYNPERYQTRGKLSKAKFEKTCLAEYAETFSTVCLDAGFYQFPSRTMIEGYLSQVPADFKMTLKVTEDITVLRFPNLPRYGRRAGQTNDHFLDAELFISAFLGPLDPHRAQIGTLIFEFGHFHPGDFERGRQFVEALDVFFGRLPEGWDYSVEIRNQTFLQPEYFDVLRRYGVAHTFNSWSRMPSVVEQLAMPGSFTADFTSARFLLKPGRAYEQAVKAFSPYTEVKEVYPDGRAALINLLTLPAPADHPRRRYLYINNRLEGSALWTIYAALSGLASQRLIAESKETLGPV